MSHERTAKRIKWIFFLLLTVGIIGGVFYYPKPKDEVKKETPTYAPGEEPLFIYHHHLPGDPTSEQLADILNKIQAKYDKLVLVTRVDVRKNPEISKEQGVTTPPQVVFLSGKQKVYEFHGLWSHEMVERKVDEILRGLKRAGKDWRPVVPGMTKAGS